MASIAFSSVLCLIFIAMVAASDPDILTDFIVPPSNFPILPINGNFFTYTGFRNLHNGTYLPTFRVTKASMAEFPALNGQSVSYAFLEYPVGTLNPPHTHPRAAELLFVLEGSLDVGFVDTANKLYNKTLQTGDMFVFPKGLVHYQYNSGMKPAAAISAFGSANAGTVSVPVTTFGTGIDDGILAKAFKTDAATVQKIKAGFVAKA